MTGAPELNAKVTFYGIYLHSESALRIWPYERANGAPTVDVLERLRGEFPTGPIHLIWDGASCRRSLLVCAAARLRICAKTELDPEEEKLRLST